MTQVLGLPIRQRALARTGLPLPLVKKDRRRAHQRKIACSHRVPHLAVVLSLGVIAPVMLFDFNSPILPDPLEQNLGRSFFGPETGHSVNGLVGRFDDAAFAQEVHLATDAEDLRGSSQTGRGPIGRQSPKPALLDPAMALIDRLSLRGEGCPAATAGLWPTRAVGCL